MDQNTATSYGEVLYHAVKQRNLNLAKELLKAGANVNHKSDEGFQDEGVAEDFYVYTPITVAVVNGDLGMVKLLLKYNPNVNDDDANDGVLPLVEAVYRGYLEVARALLAHPSIIVNKRDCYDEFALQAASKGGDFDFVELLVRHGGHSKDNYSDALGGAIQRHPRRTDIMGLLLEHGSDPFGEPMSTPSLYPLLNGRNLDAARLLLRSGATTGIPFRDTIRSDWRFREAMRWLSEDKTRTILHIKRLQLQQTDNGAVASSWDAIVAVLWFNYFGPNRQGDPPSIEDTARFSKKKFKKAYKWMIYSIAFFLYLDEGNDLLPHLCRVIHPSVALELCQHTGKTPLLLALEMFPRRDETKRQNAARGIHVLIEWNPDALKVPHPGTRRSPTTCAIVNRVPLPTLQKMITCKKKLWFTAAPKQKDPVTLLPNFLLVAAGEDCYSEADIYAFSRKYLPDMISSLMSPRVVPRRGIKRSLEQI